MAATASGTAGRRPPHILPVRCTSCGYCRIICPADAVLCPPGPAITERCIACLRCLRVCPNAAIKATP